MGKEGLHDLGFKIVVSSKITAQQAITLNKVEEELPSAANISKSDDTELQEITENVTKGKEDLIVQFEGHGEPNKYLPMCELLGLNKQAVVVQQFKVNLCLRTKKVWKNGSGTDSKPWRCY